MEKAQLLKERMISGVFRYRTCLLFLPLLLCFLLFAGFLSSELNQNGTVYHILRLPYIDRDWLIAYLGIMAAMLFVYALLSEIARRFYSGEAAIKASGPGSDRYTSQKFKEAISHLYDRFYEYDLTNDKILAGAKHYGPYGQSRCERASEMLRNFCKNNVHPDDQELYGKYVDFESTKQRFKNGISGTTIEYRTKVPGSQEYRWKSAIEHIYMDDRDGTLRAMWFISDITEKRVHLERLEQMAEEDSLTGMLNKSCTEKSIDGALAALPNAGTLFMIDLDNFKNVNDMMGHLFGDAVLTAVADALRNVFEEEDIKGRIGGDEFIVFSQKIRSREDAEAKAESVCKALSAIHGSYFNMLKLSASIGAAVCPADGVSFKELYNKADVALYHSKDLGKSCWRLYSPEMGETFLKEPSVKDEPPAGELSARSMDEDPARYTFKILYSAKDRPLSIKAIIELLTRHYKFSRGYIFENSEDGQYYSEVFEFCNDNVRSSLDKFQHTSYAETRGDYIKYFNQDGIFLMNIENIDEKLGQIMRDQNISMLLQVAVMKKGRFAGFIGFDCCDPERHLNKSQIEVLSLSAQVIATFIEYPFL